jgi:hypothetical protein
LIFVVGGDPAVIRRSRELSGYTTLAFMEAARG